MKKLIWIFIVAVAAADVYVTWRCRDSVLQWEANPAASAVYRWQGVGGVTLYRSVWLAFAAAMAAAKTRLSWLITPVWGMAHVYLLIVLVQGLPDFMALQA